MYFIQEIVIDWDRLTCLTTEIFKSRDAFVFLNGKKISLFLENVINIILIWIYSTQEIGGQLNEVYHAKRTYWKAWGFKLDSILIILNFALNTLTCRYRCDWESTDYIWDSLVRYFSKGLLIWTDNKLALQKFVRTIWLCLHCIKY